jgi:hypothetical protein
MEPACYRKARGHATGEMRRAKWSWAAVSWGWCGTPTFPPAIGARPPACGQLDRVGVHLHVGEMLGGALLWHQTRLRLAVAFEDRDPATDPSALANFRCANAPLRACRTSIAYAATAAAIQIRNPRISAMCAIRPRTFHRRRAIAQGDRPDGWFENRIGAAPAEREPWHHELGRAV